ncbi:hypothetical protein E2C01_025521 [Portunus trituberculatus]|uniref:Uncharacterized protein n=1 Tax=Portunus trituberculatus TaxID=210409 RepID=A0A5B7EI57_PORTR|nr:hypothetical protein [Portunus trituberculatus]
MPRQCPVSSASVFLDGDSGQLGQIRSVSQPEEAVFRYGSRYCQSLNLPVTRSGQPFSGSGPTVSADQGSTSVPLEIFGGTSCVPSTVSARLAPTDAGSAVVPKEALVGCFRSKLVAGGSKSSVFARPRLVVSSGSTSERCLVHGGAPGTDPILGYFPAQVGNSTGGFSGFGCLDCGGAGAPHKSSGVFGSLSGSPEFSANLVGVSGVR